MEDAWQQRVLREIDSRTNAYQERDLVAYAVPTLQKMVFKLPSLQTSEGEIEALQGKIGEVVDLLPAIPDQKSKSFDLFQDKMDALKNELKKRYNLVSKGHYRLKIWFPLGLSLGLVWGLIFDKEVVGLLLGPTVGFLVGSWFDRKAEKEGRVL